MLKLMERRHDGDVGLVGGQLGQRHLLTWRDLRGSLSEDSIPANMSDLAPQDEGGPVGLGQGQCGQLLGGGAGQDGLRMSLM